MTSEANGIAADSGAQERPRLKFKIDVDIVVVGAGLAGLTAAREAARMGASVILLESRRVGWNASGNNLGTVMPGYSVPVEEIIERVGFEDTRDLWKMSEEGVDYVRAAASDAAMPLTDGVLEVSNVDAGEQLIRRLQMLGSDFGSDVEGWQVDRVRESLKTRRYFHAIHFPKALSIDGRQYVHGLAALAEKAGVRIFENTPVLRVDPNGVRKRVYTPDVMLRCSDIILAGNVHIGAPAQRLHGTMMPTWRYAALTGPLGEDLAEAMTYRGAVTDSDGVDQFRIVDGDRLLWMSRETTWQGDASRHARSARSRIATIFPQLGKPEISEAWSGVYGQTVHGMPQVGQLRKGMWVISGFGRQGLNTSAMAGQLVARSILWGDDRWRLFSPFELVWAGGTAGRVAGQAFLSFSRKKSAAMGLLSRVRERSQARAVARERAREIRLAKAKARVEADRERAAAAMQRPNENS
ncbi:MAG: FAD-binding oxidoreductase [Afipia sp.]|nr:FAD-binding oxidoreductase [Afipia sp.]